MRYRLWFILTVVGLLGFTGVASAQLPYPGAPVDAYVFLPNQDSNSVGVYWISPSGGLSLTRTIPVGTSPRGVAVRADQSFVYVANAGSNSVSVIDVSTLTVVQTVSAGRAPGNVVLQRDGRRLYVANVDDDTISVFDANATTGRLTPASTFAITGTGPAGLALSPDDALLYVTMQSSDILQIVDTSSDTVTATVPVGSQPVNVTLSPDGSRALVANAGSSTVSVVDTTTNTVTTTVSSSAWQAAFSPNGVRYYLSTGGDGGVRVYDASTNALLQTLALTGTIQAVAADPTGQYVYAADVDNNIVYDLGVDRTTGLLAPLGTLGSGVSSPFTIGTCVPGPVEAGVVFRVMRGLGSCLGPTAVFNGGMLQMGGTGGLFEIGVPVTLDGGGAIVDTNDRFLILAGVVSGPGGLTKTGKGTLGLGPGSHTTNTYTGPTTVNAGTLILQGSAGSDSAVTVNRGATLEAFDVRGTVTVNDGGSLEPQGPYEGRMTSGTLTVNAGSTVVMELNQAYGYPSSSLSDSIVVTGGVTLGGRLSPEIGTGPLTVGQVITLISNDGNDPVQGTFADRPEGAKISFNGPLAFRMSYVGGDGNDVTLAALGDTILSISVSSSSLTLGMSAFYTARLTGGAPPYSGTMTFSAYGPNDPACSGVPVFTSAVNVDAQGVVDTAFTPPATGLYRLVVGYSGDVRNFPAASWVCIASMRVRVSQNITFNPIGGKTYGDAPFTVTASATSGLPVTLSSDTEEVCLASGMTVGIIAAGTCRIRASQAGNDDYSAATSVTQSFSVAKASQAISFGALPDKILGSGSLIVSASTNSGLAVTFSSRTTSSCTVSGSVVTPVALGTCTIAANQAGSGNYAAAPQITQSFTVLPDCSVVSIVPGQLPLATEGLAYTQALTLTNGGQPVAWSIGGALPPGVTFSGATFSGTPTTRGAFPLTVSAVDGVGCPASVALTLPVSAARRLATGAGGGAPTVRTFDLTPKMQVDFNAYAAAFTGGVSVAQGDTNGDGVPDLVTGAGPGGGPHVVVYDGVSGGARLSFLAFDPTFHAGVDVAAGDVNGDGFADVIVVGGCVADPVVRAFDGRGGAVLREYAIDASIWSCGYHVAAGDVTGDGIADIVVGSGGAGPSFVQVIDGASGATVRSFSPYGAFTGGVYVAAGDVNGDGYADIVTGAGAGGGPHVQVFDGKTGHPVAGPLGGFMAYDPAFTGGVRVAAGDLDADGKAEVIAAAGAGGGPHVRVFDGATGSELLGLFAFDPAFTGGVFVGGAATLGRMAIGVAARTVGNDIAIAGWALREGTGAVGVDAIHAWAYPVAGPSTGSGQAAAPVFVGAGTTGIARSDVAAIFGGEFHLAGFEFTGSLAAGTYDLVVFARNSVTGVFDQVRVVRISVQ